MENLEIFYISDDEMDFTVEFVSQNLVTQSNFVEFQDGWDFTFFEAPSVGDGVVPHDMTRGCHM